MINNLTKTEQLIYEEISKGKKSIEIAQIRGCSLRTIERHRSNIIKKLKIPKGTNLQLWLLQQHLRLDQ